MCRLPGRSVHCRVPEKNLSPQSEIRRRRRRNWRGSSWRSPTLLTQSTDDSLLPSDWTKGPFSFGHGVILSSFVATCRGLVSLRESWFSERSKEQEQFGRFGFQFLPSLKKIYLVNKFLNLFTQSSKSLPDIFGLNMNIWSPYTSLFHASIVSRIYRQNCLANFKKQTV